MRNAVALTALLALTLAARAADDKPPAPPPAFVQAKATEKDDTVRIAYIDTVYRLEKKKVTAQVGNTIEVREVEVRVPVQVEKSFELDGKKWTLQRADGKPVDNKDVVKELGAGKLILLAANGQVDPDYLALFKGDTLVLIKSAK